MVLDTGFSRPTLSTLIERAESDLNTRLPGADSRLRRSVLSVLARTYAGACHGLYGFLDYISRMSMYDTSEGEYLERWASIWGITRRAATRAIGTVTLIGTSGVIVPAGSTLQRTDGVQYEVILDTEIVSGTAVANIRSVVPSKSANSSYSLTLTFTSPVTGVDSVANSSTLTGGSDTETDEDLRKRFLTRIQEPPHGGAEFDYKNWALEVPNVTRVWVYPLENGAGTVVVRFMMDDIYSNGIPLSADVLEVQNYINDRRPVTADVTVVAPVPELINFTIDLRSNDTPLIRESVTSELKDFLIRDGKPGATLYLSRINEAISTATGEYDHELSAPNVDTVLPAGKIPTLGTITWA